MSSSSSKKKPRDKLGPGKKECARCKDPVDISGKRFVHIEVTDKTAGKENAKREYYLHYKCTPRVVVEPPKCASFPICRGAGVTEGAPLIVKSA